MAEMEKRGYRKISASQPDRPIEAENLWMDIMTPRGSQGVRIT